jgi:hypothetical protein
MGDTRRSPATARARSAVNVAIPHRRGPYVPTNATGIAPSVTAIADAAGSGSPAGRFSGARNGGGVWGFTGIADQRTRRSRNHLRFCLLPRSSFEPK